MGGCPVRNLGFAWQPRNQVPIEHRFEGGVNLVIIWKYPIYFTATHDCYIRIRSHYGAVAYPIAWEFGDNYAMSLEFDVFVGDYDLWEVFYEPAQWRTKFAAWPIGVRYSLTGP